MKGKRIIVGITGGIADYKVATVVREMKRRGAEVRAVSYTHLTLPTNVNV